jgi:hypothetical protein
VTQSLKAVTEYDMYCATASSEGALLLINDALETKHSVTTPCCNVVEATLMQPVFLSKDAQTLDALTLVLDNSPRADLVTALSRHIILPNILTGMPLHFPLLSKLTSNYIFQHHCPPRRGSLTAPVHTGDRRVGDDDG